MTNNDPAEREPGSCDYCGAATLGARCHDCTENPPPLLARAEKAERDKAERNGWNDAVENFDLGDGNKLKAELETVAMDKRASKDAATIAELKAGEAEAMALVISHEGHIAKLEQENAELKNLVKRFQDEDDFPTTVRAMDRADRLLKENAELRAERDDLRELISDTFGVLGRVASVKRGGGEE